MTLLPIVERELRLAARRPWTFYGRCVAAGLAMLVLGTMMLALESTRKPVQISSQVFSVLGFGSFALALLSGVFLTADCVSEEKREGTLGLLFLTDLRGWDVVLGKLASTSLVGAYCLLGVLPMLALPVMIGGVSFGQFLQLALGLLLTMGLSLSLGMLVSVLGREVRTVFSSTFFMVLVLGVGVILIAMGLDEAGIHNEFVEALTWVSPMNLVGISQEPWTNRTAFGLTAYAGGVLVQSLLILAVLGGACRALPRCWSDDRMAAPIRPGGRAHGLWNRVGAVSRLIESARPMREVIRLEPRPYQWLVLRTLGRDSWARVLFFVCYATFIGFCLAGARSGGHGYAAVAMLFAFGLHLLVKFQIALWSVRRLCEDRASGAMELLMVTPLRPAQMLGELRLALKTKWAWPVRMLVLANGLLIFTALLTELFSGSDRWFFLQFFVGGLALLWMDLRLMTKVGPWMALIHHKPQRAALGTLGWVLLPGMIGLLCLALFLSTLRGGGDDVVAFAHFVWMGWCLVAAIWVNGRAGTFLNRWSNVEGNSNSVRMNRKPRGLGSAQDTVANSTLPSTPG